MGPVQPEAADEASPGLTHLAVVLFQTDNAQITQGVVGRLRRLFEDRGPFDRSRTVIDVWLESPGGDAHAAYKLGLLLRSYGATVRVVIPDYAKSAATLLALVGDQIFMGPAAELGPLDAQIGYEQEGLIISALDRVQALDDLAQSAVQLAVSGGAAVLQSTQLSRSETITSMLNFSAQFYQPILAKLDPAMLHWSQTLLDVAVEYGQRLLATHTDAPGPELHSLPRRLVSDYPTHGFVIGLEEARELGLDVRPMAEYPFHLQVRALHRQHEDSRESMVSLLELPGIESAQLDFDVAEGDQDGHTGDTSADEGDEARSAGNGQHQQDRPRRPPRRRNSGSDDLPPEQRQPASVDGG